MTRFLPKSTVITSCVRREGVSHHSNQICHQNHIGPSCVRACLSREEDRSLAGGTWACPPDGTGVDVNKAYVKALRDR
jgi:hypothetical protein